MSSQRWSWPKGTYFQRRLKEVRRQNEEPTGETPVEVFELDVALPAALSEDVRGSEQAASLMSNSDEKPAQAEIDQNRPGVSLKQAAAPEARAATNINPRQSQTSPTQAPLAMERNEWVRTGANSSEPVDMGTEGLARAPRKGNLDRFRFALVSSGEWTRSDPNTALTLTANGAEESIAPQTQGTATDAPKQPQVIMQPHVTRDAPPPPAPSATATKTTEIRPVRSAETRVLAKPTETRSEQVPTPLLSSDNPWRSIDYQFNREVASAPDWAEIEEKFFWLANPPS